MQRSGVGVPSGIHTYSSNAIEVVNTTPRRGDVCGRSYYGNRRIYQEDHQCIVSSGGGTTNLSLEGEGEGAVNRTKVNIAVSGSVHRRAEAIVANGYAFVSGDVHTVAAIASICVATIPVDVAVGVGLPVSPFSSILEVIDVRQGSRNLRSGEAASNAAVFAGIGAAADTAYIEFTVEGSGNTCQSEGVGVCGNGSTGTKLESDRTVFDNPIVGTSTFTP